MDELSLAVKTLFDLLSLRDSPSPREKRMLLGLEKTIAFIKTELLLPERKKFLSCVKDALFK